MWHYITTDLVEGDNERSLALLEQVKRFHCLGLEALLNRASVSILFLQARIAGWHAQ